MEELDNMTPKNFLNAQIGYGKMNQYREQGEWERARWMACVIINPHLKKSINPKKLTTFPWERKSSKNVKRDIERLRKESEYQDKIEELNKKKKKDA
mgnify:FL=1|tara:strand:- start:445 stop:735 length:291 start_codon:yes stop_codon:yes gene_type:complete